jgi:hypothetical protein
MKNIHGFWQVSLVGSVMVKTSAGSFNEEGVRSSLADIEALVPATPWAALFDSSSWDMTTSGNLELIAEFESWMMAHGCQRIACVVRAGLRAHIHKQFAGKLAQEQLRYFSNLPEACDWLNEGGFAITPQTYPHQIFLQKHREENQ